MDVFIVVDVAIFSLMDSLVPCFHVISVLIHLLIVSSILCSSAWNTSMESEYDRACFIVKSSQLGLSTFDVAYVSGVSNQNLLPVNISTSFYGCINVMLFDYHLFFRLGSKVEFPHVYFHTFEYDSLLNGSIFRFSVMLSSPLYCQECL